MTRRGISLEFKGFQGIPEGFKRTSRGSPEDLKEFPWNLKEFRRKFIERKNFKGISEEFQRNSKEISEGVWGLGWNFAGMLEAPQWESMKFEWVSKNFNATPWNFSKFVEIPFEVHWDSLKPMWAFLRFLWPAPSNSSKFLWNSLWILRSLWNSLELSKVPVESQNPYGFLWKCIDFYEEFLWTCLQFLWNSLNFHWASFAFVWISFNVFTSTLSLQYM